jgi:hypothetical protein
VRLLRLDNKLPMPDEHSDEVLIRRVNPSGQGPDDDERAGPWPRIADRGSRIADRGSRIADRGTTDYSAACLLDY